MSIEKTPPTWPAESPQERLVPAQEFADRLASRRRTHQDEGGGRGGGQITGASYTDFRRGCQKFFWSSQYL